MDKETTFRLKFENEEMLQVVREIQKSLKDTQESVGALEQQQKSSMENFAKQAAASTDELKKMSGTVDDGKAKLKGLGDAADEALGVVEDKAGAAGTVLRNLGRATGPVGAAFIALAAVVGAAFLSVAKNLEEVRRAMAGVKGIAVELKDRTFAGVRAAVYSILPGMHNQIKAAAEWDRALGRVGPTLGKIYDKNVQLYDLQKQILQGARDLAIIEADRRTQIEKLQLLAADERKSLGQRAGLLREAAKEETQLNERKIFQLENEISLIKQQNKDYQYNDDLLGDIADKEAQITELRGASTLAALRAQQDINQLYDAQRKKLEALRREYRELVDDLAKRVNESGADLIEDPVERLRAQLALQETEILAFAAKIQEAAKKARLPLPDDFDEQIRTLIGNAVKAFQQGVDKLQGRDASFEKLLGVLPNGTIDQQTKANIAQAGKDAIKALKGGALEELSFAQEIQLKIYELFGLNSDQQEIAAQLIGDGINNYLQGLDIVYQTQLEQQDRVIKAREDSIDALKKQLDEELELEKQGFANSSNALRSKLGEESKLLEAEQKKRLEIEKKIARQRLVVDSLQQASQLSLAAAKLLSEGSGGFLPGLIIAASAVALLFKIQAQARANALAASAPPKFREGTRRLDMDSLVGPKHEGGGILIEAEGGERILSAAHNAIIGDMSNQELVAMVARRRQQEHLAEASARERRRSAAASGTSTSGEIRQLRADVALLYRAIAGDPDGAGGVFREEIRALGDRVEEIIQKRPVDTPLDRPILREIYEGKTKVSKVIRPKN